jgi:hypothetical protein
VKIKLTLLTLFLVLIHAEEQLAFPADGNKIPLLISDHHAEHGPFMLRHFGTEPKNRVCMVVLDAHTDTVKNLSPPAGNHDWISPLYPFPLEALVWIHTIAGFSNTNNGKVRGFYLSVSAWGAGDPPLNAHAASLDDISHSTLSATSEQPLFVSIDLDFFFMENNTPADIPRVFDALFDFTSRWRGKAIWALALSRPWLPSDEYAWELLRQSLRWFSGRSEFAPPELTLFITQLEDTSARARSLRKAGLEVPSFYGRENETPDDIRDLLEKLKARTPLAREELLNRKHTVIPCLTVKLHHSMIN